MLITNSYKPGYITISYMLITISYMDVLITIGSMLITNESKKQLDI